jgi:hypothetical protein
MQVPFRSRQLGLLSPDLWRASDQRGGDFDGASRPGSASDTPPAGDIMLGTMARLIHRKESRWPTLFHEADRRKSILANEPGMFEVADNPDASSARPWYSDHNNGYDGVARNDSLIQQEARRIGVDPDLVRAIMYVEYANGYGYGGPAQAVGLARSLYPMNIRPDRWQGLAGAGADFGDSETNIRAGTQLIKRIADRLADPNIAKIATLYNSLAKDKVTDYGAQVARVYRDKSWTVRPYPTLPGRGPRMPAMNH